MSPNGTSRAVAGGYMAPLKRDACRNCTHGEVKPASPTAKYDRKQVYCEVFHTGLNCSGICPQYVSKGKPNGSDSSVQ